MAAGKPVVATRVGVIPELVIPEKTGILVPPETPQALGNSIISLLSNQGLARRMGRAGREKAVTQLSTEIFSRSLQNALKKITGID